LPNGASAQPAARISDRLSGRKLGTLSEYVASLADPRELETRGGRRSG
jgi:hypothetical protein